MQYNNVIDSIPGIVQYPGSKARMMKYLDRLIPKSDMYLEPYIGSGVVLLNLDPRPIEAINDVDDAIVKTFRVLQDRNACEELRHRLMYTLYSRAEYARAIHTVHQDCADEVDIAWATLVKHTMGIIGTSKSVSGWSRGKSINTAIKWARRTSAIDFYRHRLSNVQIDNRDAIEFIAKWDSPTAVIYADPPYVTETRTSKLYNCEVSIEHHIILVESLLKCKSAVVLSGYQHAVYDDLLANGWQLLKFKRRTSMANAANGTNGRNVRYECIYRNQKACALAPYESEDVG